MQQWKKNVYLLWVAIFIASSCWSMVMPFMPLFLKEELGVIDGVAAWAGVIGAVNSLGMAVTAPIWGAVGDRFGRKLMMMRAGTVLAVAYLLMSLVTGPYQLLGVRIMIGVLTGFIPTAIALVGTTTPQEHVGKALALVSTASSSGTIIGPLLGGALTDLIGIRGAMLFGALAIGLATVLVLFFVKEQFTPVRRESGTLFSSLGEVLQNRTFAYLMITTILTMASLSAMEPILIPYMKALFWEGAPNWLSGGLYALPGIAFVAAASWWAARAEKWGYGTTVTLGLGLGALFILPQALAMTAYDFGGLRLAQGLAMASVNPGISALIAIVVPSALRGRAFGINQSAFSIGAMLGPLMGGFVGTWAGERWVFVATALVLVLATVWTRFVVSPRVKIADTSVA